MVTPSLTRAQRAEATRRAVALRRERASLLQNLGQGRENLQEVLERKDEVVGRIRVQTLLKALPGIGPIRSLRLMRQAGISERRRVTGLGPRQKERLLSLLSSSDRGTTHAQGSVRISV
ncbi:integration host factor, actinobacterial type [Streptomyces sp. NPDC056534]|uniref:integration host factor, actinobacterial type n=1 Tax=Streptomyces sp. NPDC056534 TaxID=3345857 RepID=UPI0036D20351